MIAIIFALLIILIIFNFFSFMWGLADSSCEFMLNKENVPIRNAKYFYDNSNLNMTACKAESFFFNLFCFGYNFAVIFYSIFYYLTRKGRKGNFK